MCHQLFIISCLQTEINKILYNSNTTPVVDACQTIFWFDSIWRSYTHKRLKTVFGTMQSSYNLGFGMMNAAESKMAVELGNGRTQIDRKQTASETVTRSRTKTINQNSQISGLQGTGELSSYKRFPDFFFLFSKSNLDLIVSVSINKWS